MGSGGPQGYLLQEAGPLVPAQQGARSLPRGRYSGRSDAGCLYELTVKLLSEHEDVLAEFNSGQVAVPPDSDDAGWIDLQRTAFDAKCQISMEKRPLMFLMVSTFLI